jgi:predicted dehydrogenase
MNNKVKIAIIGVGGFGEEFIPIYQNHPDAELYAICSRSEDKVKAKAKKYGVGRTYTDYKEMLRNKDIDAIHIITPADTHGPITIDCLQAEKHTACTVTMGLTVEECTGIVKLRRKVNRNYMMMETQAYTREFLYIKKLKDEGKLGKIQFLRGIYMQNMEEWGYPWPGFPPLSYSTHSICPISILAGAPVSWVFATGSGRIREDFAKNWNNPFSIESMLVSFKDSDISAVVIRSLNDFVRQYVEGFDVYGKKLSFEYTSLSNENPILFIGGEDAERIKIPDFADLLPKEIARFTRTSDILDNSAKQELSFVQGAGHGGSHPHLVHEFIRSIVEKRDSAIDAEYSANWTCAGLLGHKSSINGGEKIYIPDFWNL